MPEKESLPMSAIPYLLPPFPMPRKRKQRKAATQYWIGYCRKSTDSEDKQVHTLQDQTRMIEECYGRFPAEDRRVYPLKIVQEAQSAYYPGRPVYNAILQMADRGEVYGLLVVHPNRVSRNHADSGAFVQRLVEGTIRFLDTTAGKRYTGNDSNDIFMLTLEGAMSWKDSRDKGDRILQAMRMRAAEGKTMGPVRIGYRTVFKPDGSRMLEVVPEITPLIRQLFELAATSSYSVLALTREAQRLGLKSRSGKKIPYSGIHQILRDPLYKGYIRFNGVISKGMHEPMIEEALWERVQIALTARRTGVAKPQKADLRDLFIFGGLLHCPHCRRLLCPYRVKEKYIYYECKNPETECRVLVAQTTLAEQLPAQLSAIALPKNEGEIVRSRLLRKYHQDSRDEVCRRKSLNAEYEKVTREIEDVFAQRKEAQALGIVDVVDGRLGELQRRRDEIQRDLNAAHIEGNAWIDATIRSFELFEPLQEAIFFGSRPTREMVLRGIVSNFSVDGKTLVPELRSPFRQCAKKRGHPEWWSELYDVRTEIEETYQRLYLAMDLIKSPLQWP
jgi:site-specific DNA recombinase